MTLRVRVVELVTERAAEEPPEPTVDVPAPREGRVEEERAAGDALRARAGKPLCCARASASARVRGDVFMSVNGGGFVSGRSQYARVSQ